METNSKASTPPRYTMVIQWDAESNCYVVSLPEWGPYCKAYGDTYEKAAKNGREVLELLIKDEKELPSVKQFQYPAADVVPMADNPQRADDRRTPAEPLTKRSA